MEQARVNGSRSGSGSGPIAGDTRDWSRLPEDLLVSVLGALHVADAVRSGAVCTSWNAAYAALSRFRVPLPRQPPCLLYASDDIAPGAAALHCPVTGSTLQIPFPKDPLARRSLLGSGHGWLVTADEDSDLHLLNPVTGAQIALPPITALHHVERGTDEDGDPAYLVYENMPRYDKKQFEVDTEPTFLKVKRARDIMYERVVLSASPSAGRACVVLLLHMPQGEVSFARLGDDRWTWVSDGDETGLEWRYGHRGAMYSAADGLFYLLHHFDASMYSLDLNGPSPVARKVLNPLPNSGKPTKYLVETPAGDILQVWRTQDYEITLTPVYYPPDYVDEDGESDMDPCLELNTIEMKVFKVDLQGQRVELIKSLPEYALFLGFNDSMCLPVNDFPGLKPNCAYITDDFIEYVNILKLNRREIGVWSIAEQSMSKLVDVSPVTYPWLNWPSPIWIQPSLF